MLNLFTISSTYFIRSIFFIRSIAMMALFLLASCMDNGNNPKYNGEDYFPLQSGNYWDLAHLPLRSIELTETIDNKEYYGMIYDKDTIYYRKTDDGRVYEQTKTTPEILRFNFAADVGQKWTYQKSNFPYIWEATLTSKNDTITIANQTFLNCYRFYFDIPQMADEEQVVWLAPGIGFIEEYYPGGTSDRKVLTRAKIDGVEMEF